MKGRAQRTHPIQIFHSLKRFVFFLILPFLQGLFLGTGTLGQRLYSAGLNALPVAGIVVFAVLDWRFRRVTLRGNRLTVEKGVFLRSEARLHAGRIEFMSVEHTPWLSLFRAARIHLETPGGSRRRPDFSFLLGKKAAEELSETIFPRERGELRVKTPFRKIILLAASWSNAASGLLVAVPFINRLGAVLGEDVAERIYEAAGFGQRLILAGTPPLFASLAWGFIAGWGVAFLSRLFQYGRFWAGSDGDVIVTEAGLISRRRNITRRAAIHAVILRQSLPMVLLRIHAVYLQVVGYGKQKGAQALLSAGKAGEVWDRVEELTGLRRPEGRTLRPLASCRRHAVAAPIIALTMTSLGCAGWIIFRPESWDYAAILWGFLGALELWRLCICLMGFRRAGVCFSGETVEISTHRRFSLIQGILPRERIQEIRVTQSRGQRKRGDCSLSLWIYGEGKSRISVRGLRYSEVLDCLFLRSE